MSRLFGWSYPPGCSGPPDEVEEPCAVCGKMPDDCECPECAVVLNTIVNKDVLCGIPGCLEHMETGKLIALIELRDCQLRQLQDEAKKRERKAPPCPVCGVEHKITIFDEAPIRCCGYEFYQKWEKEY